MKDGTLKERASGRIVGRGGIIAIVVVFSALSFTFGYFVGKNHPQIKAESVAQVVSQPSTTQLQQNAAVSNPQPPLSEGRPAGEERPPQDKKGFEQEAVSSDPQGRPVSDKASVEHTETVSTAQKEKPKKESEEVVSSESRSTSKHVENDVTYTVQIGALKNAAEARRLKEKYAKKGYKTSVSVSHGKQKEKIYKVRAGDFKEKKEAETLARRLKKSEGLSAFVTIKGK